LLHGLLVGGEGTSFGVRGAASYVGARHWKVGISSRWVPALVPDSVTSLPTVVAGSRSYIRAAPSHRCTVVDGGMEVGVAGKVDAAGCVAPGMV
jgi:hypothetical protein